MARIAKALDVLRSQVNLKYPGRDKSSDGWIGDASHASRTSDHNPDANGVVHALDLTHDPAHGFDSYAFADYLRLVKDNRISYVISNRRIFLGHGSAPYTWSVYTGVNPHTAHVHVSISASPSLADNGAVWDIGVGVTPVKPPAPATGRPVLKRGSKGDDVKALQILLADGFFGPATEAAVKGFQKERGLVADGICGPQTWAELESHVVPGPAPIMSNIVATVFGGAGDRQTSAYDGHVIGDTEVGCALPARVAAGTKVRVINPITGVSVTAPVIDVGPWSIDNPYWLTGARPRAETCYNTKTQLTSGPNAGKVPLNDAGIDLTPAAAKAIGIAGKGRVNWLFV